MLSLKKRSINTSTLTKELVEQHEIIHFIQISMRIDLSAGASAFAYTFGILPFGIFFPHWIYE